MSAASAFAVFSKCLRASRPDGNYQDRESTNRFRGRETASEATGTPVAEVAADREQRLGEVASAPPARRRLTLANRVA